MFENESLEIVGSEFKFVVYWLDDAVGAFFPSGNPKLETRPEIPQDFGIEPIRSLLF